MASDRRMALTAFAACIGLAGWAHESVKVSDFGFDSADSTRFVQSALDSGARTIVFDRQQGPWVVERIFVRSNACLMFEDGVELQAKKGGFGGIHDWMVDLSGVTNVTIRGGAQCRGVFRMHKRDYQKPPYARSEWRHAMYVCNSANIRLENMSLVSSGGDGLCVCGKDGGWTERMTIRNCLFDDNHRQGISVGGVRGLVIEDSVMRNTSGTPPSAGIDFEPDWYGQPIDGCVMRNCIVEDNDGGGVELYAGQMDARSVPIGLALEGCRISRNRKCGVFFCGNVPKGQGVIGGRVSMRNCRVEDSGVLSLHVCDSPMSGFRLDIENCVFSGCRGGWLGTDVAFRNSNPLSDPNDGIRLKDVKVVQTGKPHRWFDCSKSVLSPKAAEDVTGNVTLVDTNGRVSDIALNRDWCARELPRPLKRPLPGRQSLVADALRLEVLDSCPGEMVELAPVRLMSRFRYLFFAEKAGPVRFRGRQTPRFSTLDPLTSPVEVKGVGHGGGGTMPMPGTNSETVVFTAPCRGMYAIDIQEEARCNLLLESCDMPVAIDMRDSCRLVDANGMPFSLYFMPDDKQAFALLVSGAERDMSCRVDITDARGECRASDGCVFAWRAFEFEKGVAGHDLWRIDFSPASGRPFRLLVFDLLGTQPALFLSKEKTWR